MTKMLLRISLSLSLLASLAGFSTAQETAPEVTEIASQDVAKAAASETHGADDHAHSADAHELDPTHMNLSEEAENAVEWRSEKAIATLIIFGLLLAGLTAVAWKPIALGLEKREHGIASNIANAQKASQDAIAKLTEYEAKLASANQEAQQILADARKDAEATGQRLIATAQEEAVRHRERAVAEIDSAKRVALSELAEKSTDLAITLAQHVVGREVNASDHQNLIQEMLTQLPSQN